jgi:hypothetical protein
MVSITKWLVLGLVGAFAVKSLIAPQEAYATTEAFRGVGTALGNLGAGLKSLGQGAGSGAAGLLNPLWTLRDLIYGPQGGDQPTKETREVISAGLVPPGTYPVPQPPQFPTPPRSQPTGGGYTYSLRPTIGPAPVTDARVSWDSGATKSLPLSADAVKYYQRIGVAVSPTNTQTVQSNNSSNATSIKHTGASSGPARGGGIKAARARGYSTGKPTSRL